jgi:hypothetical protein
LPRTEYRATGGLTMRGCAGGMDGRPSASCIRVKVGARSANARSTVGRCARWDGRRAPGSPESRQAASGSAIPRSRASSTAVTGRQWRTSRCATAPFLFRHPARPSHHSAAIRRPQSLEPTGPSPDQMP